MEVLEEGTVKEAEARRNFVLLRPEEIWSRVWSWVDNVDQRDISQLLNALTYFIQQQRGLKSDACGIYT